jgi:aryl-alcohol dehydrogenase-like predicted oxidoreductase
VAQVALRWTLQKDVVSSVIIGATSIKQLEDNMGAGTGWNMSKEEVFFRSVQLEILLQRIKIWISTF